MSKRMLIDATHPEETRVVVLSGTRLEEFDFESSTKKQIKGNIYLAKVTRVEPSLQAAFVEYGGNRHGFLAFSEIHPDYYQIPVSDREAMLAREAHLPEEEDEPELQPVAQVFTREDGAESGYETSYAADMGEQTQPSSEGLAPDSIYASEQTITITDDFAEPSRSEPVPSEDEDGAFVERSEAASTVETIGGDEMEEVSTRRQRSPYRHYKIQEVIKRRQILLIQVTKEERGNKGAALTTYLSLAGRYCVLMPNAGRGGGVSRKITSTTDRRRLKELMEELSVPDGMGVIVRTAGSERSKAEIHRDYDYLLRLWDDIRELTLRSSAPALIYEEGSLIKRAIRDLYSRDIEEVLIEGEDGYRNAKDFMRMLMPSHAARVKSYRDPVIPLFHRFQIDQQIDQIHNPTVQLRSGGYIVINPTEALVAIDVNSGRSTRERNIEETATKTNLEAADEVARQLRLRDLAGLIVIDFIDMEEARNRGAVERRLKDAMKNDRARIQLGRVSPFGLLELSRQRLRPSLIEASTQICPHCTGTGTIRSTESTALVALRALEEEGIRRRTAEITLWVPTHVALYILNQKREGLRQIEQRYNFTVIIQQDDTLIPPAYRLDRIRSFTPAELSTLPVPSATPVVVEDELDELELSDHEDAAEPGEAGTSSGAASADAASPAGRRRRRRRRGRGQAGREGNASADAATIDQTDDPSDEFAEGEESGPEQQDSGEIEVSIGGGEVEATTTAPEGRGEPRRRRRGRRGGRRHSREEGAPREQNSNAEFGGYGPPEDFARDGDLPADDLSEPNPVFGETDLSVTDEGVPYSSAESNDDAEIAETTAEAAPRRRAPRRRRGAAEAETETTVAVEAITEEGEPQVKPRRGRRKASAASAETAETAETAEIVADTSSSDIAIDSFVAATEPTIAVIDPAAPVPDADIPVQVPQATWPEDQPATTPTEQVIIVGETETTEPTRKGWWRRLM